MEGCFGETWRMLTMLFLTFGFFLVEIIVGYVTNSVALVADSFHMLSDVVSLLIGLAALRISKWPSRRNTFGWVRAEVLGALVNSVFLLALCFSILLESIKRLAMVEEIRRPLLLLAVGSAGLLVNVVGLFFFSSHGHGHSHQGASEPEEELQSRAASSMDMVGDKTKKSDSTTVVFEITGQPSSKRTTASQLNIRGVFLHVLGDALGSVVVIISSIVIWQTEGQWRFYVDPAMSFAMIILIIATTTPLLKQTSMILLQTPPDFIDQDKLKLQLNKVEGVLGVHEFHVWQLTGNRIVLSAHITCTNKQEYMKIATVVKDLFHREGIHSTTIQPEFVGIADMADNNESEDKDELECKLLCSNMTLECVKDSCCDPIATYSSRKVRTRRQQRGFVADSPFLGSELKSSYQTGLEAKLQRNSSELPTPESVEVLEKNAPQTGLETIL